MAVIIISYYYCSYYYNCHYFLFEYLSFLSIKVRGSPFTAREILEHNWYTVRIWGFEGASRQILALLREASLFKFHKLTLFLGFHKFLHFCKFWLRLKHTRWLTGNCDFSNILSFNVLFMGYCTLLDSITK